MRYLANREDGGTAFRRLYSKTVRKFFDRGTFERLDKIGFGHKQFTWAQRVMSNEMKRCGRKVRAFPPQGKRRVPDFVRIYFDAETCSFHQRYGHDKEFNRQFGWLYRR